MIVELLTPGVKHRYDPGDSTKMMAVTAKGQHSVPDALKKEVQKNSFIILKDRIQFVWNSEDHMIISDSFNQFRVPFQLPFLCKSRLTAGTNTIVAGIRMDHDLAAILTFADIVSERTGLTVGDTENSLFSFYRESRMH